MTRKLKLTDTDCRIGAQQKVQQLLPTMQAGGRISKNLKSPWHMVGLQQDGIVPFSNTVIAARAMRGPNVRHHAITTRRMDHEQATAPSLGLVRAFFDGGFAAVPSDPLPKLK